MEKYYVVGLTTSEVANRKLSQIGDAIREEFIRAAELARKGKIVQPKKLWAIIKFEDSLTSEKFNREYKEYFSVLYINETAKQISESKNVSLRILKQANSLPKYVGTYMSVPIFTA